MTGWLWSLITVLGPILLIGAVAWMFVRNRNARRGTVDQAERGARELREDLEREDARDNSV